MMRFSVIMPVERAGGDAQRAIRAVLSQTFDDLELILVGSNLVDLPADPRIVVLSESDRNPARRRNLAAAKARGQILAFIDDDAFADPDWLANAAAAFASEPDLVALGGPDPAPNGSPVNELISDTLLATPLIGSGIACHEGRDEPFDLTSPHDVALVNLFVPRAAFDDEGGFDESIGYIGEDTELVARLLRKGRVAYRPDVVVRHRRRSFPTSYLGQRWRYRVKSGRMLVAPSGTYRKNPKILTFLGAGFVAIALSAAVPRLLPLLVLAYVIIVFALALPRTRLPFRLWLFVPLFFALHHATYFVGIVTGALLGLMGRARA